MNRRSARLACLFLTGGLLLAAAASAQSELDVTMTVFDDLSDVDVDLLVEARPDNDRYEEDLFDLDNDGIPDDQEDETGLFDQYRELEADFDVVSENDGFEVEDADEQAWREFETEDDFEEGERLDNDVYEPIEMPDPAA